MKFFLTFLFISFQLFAQVEYSHGVLSPGEFPGFYVDAANYKSEIKGKTRLDVYFQIPYSNLQFVKIQNKFRAKYSFTITIKDEDKEKIIIEKTWNGKIIASSFKEAASEKNSKFGFKSFELPPENYSLSIVLYDKDSKKEYSLEGKLEVRDFSKPLMFSDILFIESEVDSQIVLNISNTIPTSDSSIYFYYELYSDKEDEINVEYQFESEDNDVILGNSELVFAKAGVNSIKKKLDNSALGLGKHKLVVQAKASNGDIISGVSKLFVSTIEGFPPSITDLDEAITQMEYIATREDIDEMLDEKDYSKKLELFKAFWKKKDPAPSTKSNRILKEYFRRVAYANKNFKHYFDGWKTDMGMIYIVLGPPDNVDRHPFEYDSRPYEIWTYYNISQSFYFLDETGFGDFRLLNKNYGDWYRYRQ